MNLVRDIILQRRTYTRMPTPLLESTRIKLAPAYIGDVRAWKADDANETLIIAIKNPAVDTDDTSFYAFVRGSAAMQYLGTTVLGKDGGVQPFVYNDGTVGALITETPVAGQSGTFADLWCVTFQYRLTAEPLSSGVVDTWLRSQFKSFMIALRDLAAKYTV
jgi:hypothetical protein